MFRVGDKVRIVGICAETYSKDGIIAHINIDVQLPITVKFDDGSSSIFDSEELLNCNLSHTKAWRLLNAK